MRKSGEPGTKAGPPQGPQNTDGQSDPTDPTGSKEATPSKDTGPSSVADNDPAADGIAKILDSLDENSGKGGGPREGGSPSDTASGSPEKDSSLTDNESVADRISKILDSLDENSGKGGGMSEGGSPQPPASSSGIVRKQRVQSW